MIYNKTDHGGDLVDLDWIDMVKPTPNDLDECRNDLQIADADAALSGLPTDVVDPMISAINVVDRWGRRLTNRTALRGGR